MHFKPLLFALPLAMAATGCATMSDSTSSAAPMAGTKLMAGDGSARGEAMITQAADGLHVVVKAMGLTPGTHAVHIHTTGTCTGPDFTSAGGHWNPTNRQHGKDNPAGMHMGDMPNMLAGPDGTGEIEYHVAGGMISGGSGASPAGLSQRNDAVARRAWPAALQSWKSPSPTWAPNRAIA